MSLLKTEPALNDCAPPLTAKLAPWMRRFIEQPSVSDELLKQHGSTVHLTVATEFKRNISDLLSPIRARGLQGGLFFARKANKLPWFVRLAHEAGIGVDTASFGEVDETLRLGVDPKSIVVTAMGKDQKLVSLCIDKGCLLIVDNADELDLIADIAKSINKQARIGLRFSGFPVKGEVIFSRFGLPLQDAGELLSKVAQTASLKLEILHAHLDRYDITERATAASRLIDIVDHAATLGLNVTGIDLGGGILMRYLDSESQWEQFQERLKGSVLGTSEPFTYLRDGLGYYKVGNELWGKADLYPAWNAISKERFIAAVLDQSEHGVPLHKKLSDRKLHLYFEPGRALLDNVGMTLSRVSFRKRDTLGNLLIGLSMNRTNLRPFRAEFCCDPILLCPDSREVASEGAFLVGNLCSESDIILRRKLRLKALPQTNDIFCFPNTAGYLAHHMEIGTHGNPLPANLLIDDQSFVVSDTLP